MTRLRFSSLVIVLVAIITLSACSEDPPGVRVRNDYKNKVNVQLKPAVGSTININDVQTGVTTVGQDVAEAEWTASATVQSSSAEPNATFRTTNDNIYTVVITNTEPPGMQVLVEEK